MKNGRCDVTQRVETILVNKNKNDVPVFPIFIKYFSKARYRDLGLIRAK